MPAMVFAVVWTYWIAVPLAAAAVLVLPALIGGYLKKVHALKYPKR